MEQKLQAIFSLVTRFQLAKTEANELYWVTFTDAYGEETLSDPELVNLVDRVYCITKINARSALRYLAQALTHKVEGKQ
jgi:hypothetical protein